VKAHNVLFLIRSWAFGGSHTIVLLLLKHLPPGRFNVICVPYDTWSGSDELFIAQARKRGLPLAEERIPWKSRSNWWRARKAVSDLVAKYDIDLIHTHDPHSNTMIGIGRNQWPCACVASAYGWWDGPFPLRRTVYQWIERDFALPHFERVITVSQHMKNRILRGPTSGDRVRVIHTGIDLPEVRQGGGGPAASAPGPGWSESALSGRWIDLESAVSQAGSTPKSPDLAVSSIDRWRYATFFDLRPLGPEEARLWRHGAPWHGIWRMG